MSVSDEEAESYIEVAVEAMAPTINDLARLLGESPEAWRGADIVFTGLTSGMAMQIDGPPPASEEMLLRAVMWVTTAHIAFRAHPMAPRKGKPNGG